MTKEKIIYLLVGIIVMALVLLVVAFIIGRNTSKKATDYRLRKRPGKKLYYRLNRVPLLGKYLLKVRKYIEMIELSDEQTIEKKTVRTGLSILSISIVLWIILIIMGKSLLFTLEGLLLVYMLQNQLIRLFVDRLENKLLKEFIGFLTIVRHKYNEHHMVDEAVYDAIEETEYAMARHATKMHEVLVDESLDVEAYYEIAPNKYFKSFVALAFLVLKFGDHKINDSSSFLRNLNYLKQEISMELLQREKVNYLLSSLTLISVLPLFLVKPLESWAMKSMPELMNYYQGIYGMVAQIILFLLVVIAYQMIVKMRKVDEVTSKPSNNEALSILKIPWIKKLIDQHIRVHYTKAKKWDKLLKLTSTHISVEQFYARRISYGFTAFFMAIVMSIILLSMARSNIISVPYKGDQSAVENVLYIEAMDQRYIESYTSKEEGAIREALTVELESEESVLIETHLKRIMDKIVRYEKTYFTWMTFLICILLGFVGNFIPGMVIVFQRNIMAMHMEDEVLQFHTVILMLMPIKRMSVIDLLEWMGLFAVLFKEDINECINDFELGDLEALEAMKSRVAYDPFIRIIENLQATADKITIEEAFDELLVERGFYQEKRKQDTDILIQKKGSWGKLIAFVPMTMTILGFLLIPFTHLGLNQFNHYLSDITNTL